MNAPFVRLALRAATCAAPLLLAAACATARPPAGTVATGRLGLAKAPGTVPAGRVQVEAGYSEARQDQRTRRTVGETLVRVGMGPRTEARIGFPSYLRTTSPAAPLEGLGDASVAVRHRFRDAAGWAPAVGITAGTTLPTGADRVGAGEPQPEATLAADWRVSPILRTIVTASERSAVAAGDRFGQTTLAAGGRVLFSPLVMGQVDYAHATSTRAGAPDVDHLRAGVALRLTSRVQLDAWAGNARADGTNERLFGVGFAGRW